MFDGEYVTQSGQRVTVKTGCVTKRTYIQAISLAIVCPLLYSVIHNEWNLEDMAIQAVLVGVGIYLYDALRPCHIYH